MDSYSRQQEFVNGLISGAGVLFGIAGLPVLTGMATSHHSPAAIIGSGVYGFCFLLLFTVSTIYHITSEPAEKQLFKKLDHISIYFLIAGTYTLYSSISGTSILILMRCGMDSCWRPPFPITWQYC
jgi:hemolysin III